MGALSISLGVTQTQAPEAGDLRVFVDVSQGFAIPLPAGSGNQNIWVMKPQAYKGFYSVQTQNLADGPVNMLPPQIVQDSGTGLLSVAVQGLWAYDELGDVPVRSYRWQRNGVDIPGATEPQYMPVSEDAGQTLHVVETATDANGERSQISNGAAVAALPDPFEVSLETGGLLRITGNDGRSFSVDDPANYYDGTYSIPAGSLASGPVALVTTVLAGDGSPEVGETLSIRPALFAYDAALGGATVSYTTNATNAIDASDPVAPTLRIDTADAGRTITVTATATQGANATTSVSNGVAIPDPFQVVLETGGLLQITGNDGRSFSVDDPANYYDGTYSIPAGSLASGPVALVTTVLAGDGSPEVGETLSIRPALFAYDAALGGATVSYTTNATNAIDASDPVAPTLRIDTADAGRTITVTATATQGANATTSVSNGVAIPDPFQVVLETGGLLQITGNDGRSFSVDDPTGLYDGTYSVSVVALAAGPVALMQTVLAGDGSPEVGETLSIRPALFAYDAALGGITVSYSTNGASRVDASNPVAPTLRIDTADAGRTITVTATATQGANATTSVSNGVAVAALPDPFEVILETGGLLRITGNDGRSFSVDDPANYYDGTYSIPVGSLASGPVALVTTVLAGDGSPEVGETLSIQPALFAYDAALGGVTVSYSTNGASRVDASDPSAPTLQIDAADAGRTITVTATATQGANATTSVSNGVAVAALPDPFEVILESDGTLRITGNDGRSFSVDDATGTYNGTYSIPAGSLASGPVALVTTVLAGDGSPEVGETLSIRPALFAYDPDLGDMSVSYTTNATNAVDASDPDAPTLRLDAADAGRTITVTARAVQGTSTTDSVSNGVAVAAGGGGGPLSASLVSIQQSLGNTTTPTFTVDLSGYAAGDLIYILYGIGATSVTAVTVDGRAATNIRYTGGSGGARLHCFEHVMPDTGSATATVVVTLPGARPDNALMVVGVKGGRRNAIAHQATNSGETLSASVAPASASNVILAMAMGRDDMFGAHSWTNASQASGNQMVESFAGAAFATATNVPVAPYTVTFEHNPAAVDPDLDAGLVAIALSGA